MSQRPRRGPRGYSKGGTHDSDLTANSSPRLCVLSLNAEDVTDTNSAV